MNFRAQEKLGGTGRTAEELGEEMKHLSVEEMSLGADFQVKYSFSSFDPAEGQNTKISSKIQNMQTMQNILKTRAPEHPNTS